MKHMIEDGRPNWIKARASLGAGACVEVAAIGERIALRDSKNPDTPPLYYTKAEIRAFLDGARNGEFDHLVAPKDWKAIAVFVGGDGHRSL
jgi:hypothetical protein